MNKMYMELEGFYIYITKQWGPVKIRYNLKDKFMERFMDGKWEQVQHQYKFFTGYRIQDINTMDSKFEKLLLEIKRLLPDCTSISTFLTRIPDFMFLENYINEGVQYSISAQRDCDGCIEHYGITKPLNYYNKTVVKFFKEYNIKVDKYIENSYKESDKYFMQVIQLLVDNPIELSENFIMQILKAEWGWANRFKLLVTEHNYDMISLLKYLFEYLQPFENLEYSQAIQELEDYYRMAKTIGRKVKKYPKYLRSMHDIIRANYQTYKKEYDEKLFYNLRKEKLVHKGNKFCMVIPETSKDIVKEGTDLNHCVSSYVEKILNQKTYIFFLRDTKLPDNSLVTLEYKEKKIIQARGSYNRNLTEDEMKYLKEYCKIKKIELCVGV